MSLIELPRRRAEPRVFVEAEPGLHRRLTFARRALAVVPPDLDLPGHAALLDALDRLDGQLAEIDAEEPELPLFTYAARLS